MSHRPQPVHSLIRELRARRIALGLDRHDVARASGYHPDSITTWENGHASPTLRALLAYAAAVEARIDLVALTPAPMKVTDATVGLRADHSTSARLTRAGKTAAQIADEFGCTVRTVVRHRARARKEAQSA